MCVYGILIVSEDYGGGGGEKLHVDDIIVVDVIFKIVWLQSLI